MNEKNIIKSVIEEIKPDSYMKTRISSEINEQIRPKKASYPKRIAAAVFAFVFVLGGTGGFYHYYNHNNVVSILPEATDNYVLDFTIIAYASDDAEKKSAIKLDENNINLFDSKISVSPDEYGNWEVHSSADGAIDVLAENISEVTFKCENGGFSYLDSPLIEHMKSMDKNFEVTHDNFSNYHYSPDTKEFTAKTYDEDDVIQCINYFPVGATDYLLINPQTEFSNLPADNIYITVKFKSGESVTKQLRVSFNEEGNMQLEYVH